MRMNLSTEDAVLFLLQSIFPMVCTPFGVVVVSHAPSTPPHNIFY